MSTSSIKRREFLAGVATGAASLAISPWARASESRYFAAGAPAGGAASGLAEPKFRPLPLGSIRPEGWLLRQLRLQADGLTGHLDEFWPDVAQSQWFGGTAEGWERAPYWLDGAIPLAWVLDDAALKAKVKGRVDHIIANQRPDGWYAPYPADANARSYDLWAILLANKVLVQYHEATGEAAVLEAVMRNLKATADAMDRRPLFDWGKFRWYEGLIPVYYAYERTGQAWLLDLARKLHEQGFDYMTFYGGEDITIPTPRRGLWRFDKHVVNTGMALKAYALSWRLSRRDTERAFPARMLEILDRYHGQATGMFTGDECLSGTNPVQGTELCAVVEAMYSLEHLVSITGTPAFADRLERIAFNALPATFAPDMWSHQYDQQVNQVQCTINPDHMWSTNGPESNLYGLEPNYGCCTSNLHQGWPKFAAHLWMRAGDGIAAVAYAPSSARFDTQGAQVRVATVTDYPFRETVKIQVQADKGVGFPLVLRVPGWAQGATLRVAGGAAEPLKSGTFHTLERQWPQGSVEIDLHLPMQAKTSTRYNGAIAIERGPLVYSLKLGEEWTRVNADKPHRELPHADWEVRPTTPWDYALLVDETNPDAGVTFAEQPVGEKPFSPDGAGMEATVKGRQLRNWRLAHGWAAEVPPGLQESRQPLEELTLIPYGCTNIRVTEFPRLRE
ncbi:MAG: glycoside hydrolase family 127 protein [Sedimentisphaerales bacterium]|nr:glycoside hydrolase family 127 protein [Sedimentisphaerales bacterium]